MCVMFSVQVYLCAAYVPVTQGGLKTSLDAMELVFECVFGNKHRSSTSTANDKNAINH